ncbi:hypothetical protein L6R53_07100 [Myxococcota bacterium]|nr:hypothetical protein [Myxococcota bacterium]
MLAGTSLLLWWLGTGPASGAEPAQPCTDPAQALACAPTTTPGTTADNYWRRWHQQTTEAMSGRTASVLYREPASTMDAYWRLAAFDRQAPWLDEQDALRARDLARLGVLTGLERTLRQTFERSEALGVLYRIGSTASGANLAWEARPRRPAPDAPPEGDDHVEGGLRLQYNEEPAGIRAARARLEEDDTSAPGGARPQGRAGLALQLVDGDEDEAVLDPDLALTSYLELRALGPDALRLELSHPLPPGAAERKAEKGDGGDGQWSTSLRQGLLPSVDLVGRLQGSETLSWRPERATGGLALRLPTRRSWTTRVELGRAFPYEASPTLDLPIPGEWRVSVSLRANLRWNLPQPWDGWPLGRVPGTPGRDMPEVPGVELPR